MDAQTRQDGLIRIKRSAIPMPEIHTRRKRLSGGRKRFVEKRITMPFPVEACLDDGSLEVVNAKAAWLFRESGIDVMALRLLDEISDHYQQTDQPPEKVGCVW